MLKMMLVILVAVTIGYWLGFNDAQTYSENIFARTIHSVGGGTRNKVKTDPDQTMDSLEKPTSK